ncbi:MAG: DUF1499 domain-containing protein [Leptolyngbya sp. LCM1.Bin17]|nr:MAG: DUF1499 domain-containing protein [Leptolyngbya sp. LCM1.Bin17]
MLRSLLSLVLTTTLALSAMVGLAQPVHANPTNAMHLAALPLIGNLFSGQRPSNLGVKDGKLAPCPSSPNCVISQGSPDADHAIAPLQYDGDPSAAMEKLVAVVKAMPRTTIIEQTNDYLYAEFASQLMGYVDDVEFYLDPAASAIQVRSASRLGQSDLGVNRKRIEAIRSEFS